MKLSTSFIMAACAAALAAAPAAAVSGVVPAVYRGKRHFNPIEIS